MHPEVTPHLLVRPKCAANLPSSVETRPIPEWVRGGSTGSADE